MSVARTCKACGADLPSGTAGALCESCRSEAAHTPTLRRESTTPAGISVTTASLDSPAPQRALPAAGDTFGPYRILRPLGSGGMGAVFEAEEASSGRRVALKVLGRAIDSVEMRKRFLREGRLAASVNHAHAVYVYGTEEIEGRPAIAMELVAGGTLQDRVAARGPMPVAEAVDAVLQLIAGLEAAAAIGVLHRDVKPSNCFVDADGSVKVGDFGLSISMLAPGETQLTTQGTFLGTPAFASPEQLKADDVDLRSDLYSVGATLFYLLTARMPFDADNMVKLIATVLDTPATSPSVRRPDLPRGLSDAVLRCLEKQRERRFATYDDLRRALLPFGSASPAPAPLGPRLLAGLIDLTVGTALVIAFHALVLGDVGSVLEMQGLTAPQFLLRMVGPYFLLLAWFFVPEGIWGATAGKAIFRLRLRGKDGGAIGIGRAALRALVCLQLPALPSMIYALVLGREAMAGGRWGGALGAGFYAFLLALFLPARRRNGYAAIHDLLFGTRVVLAPTRQPRPVFELQAEPAAAPAGAAQIGPYEVIASLESTSDGEWLLGRDPRLLRSVWIRRRATEALSPFPRAIARPRRLRWLNGRRTVEEHWDAFEAPSGSALPRILDRRRDWETTRAWLLDLGEELLTASKEGSLPDLLALDRVWIAADGGVKLLEFPAPGGPATCPAQRASDDGASARLLARVAVAVLEGRSDMAASSLLPAVPLPLHARAWLQGLPATGLEAAIVSLRGIVRQPASVSWQRRLALLVACALFPLLDTAFVGVGFTIQRRWAAEHPGILPLRICLATAANEGRNAEQRHWAEVYIAARLRATVEDPREMNSIYAQSLIDEGRRKEARRIVAENPSPDPKDVASAEIAMRPYIDRRMKDMGVLTGRRGTWDVLGYVALGTLLILVTLPAIVSGLLFRGGLVLGIVGVAFVRRDGAPAGRGRVFFRQLVAGAPALLMAAVLLAGVEAATQVVACSILGGVMLLSAALSVPRGRSLPDWIAGTRMVPR